MGTPGNCGNGVRPYKFSIDDLKDIKLNSGKQMDKGCGAAIDGTGGGSCLDNLKNKGFGWPDNGEFEWGGMGDNCDLCDGEYGCECRDTNHIGGKRGQVKRVSYKGDQTKCCLANIERQDTVKLMDGYTCDPENRKPSSTGCAGIYADSCKDGKIITDTKCALLETSNSTLYNQLMKTACNGSDHYLNDKCIAWCANNSTECSKLNIYKECKVYEIPVNKCTPQEVLDISAKCVKYGIKSEQGLALYKCTEASVKALEDDCKTNNVEATCSPTSVQDAIDNATRAAQLEMAAATSKQVQDNYDKTQATIQALIGTSLSDATTPPPETTTPEPTPEPEFDIMQFLTDYSIIIVVVIILISLLSSSSISSLFMLKK